MQGCVAPPGGPRPRTAKRPHPNAKARRKGLAELDVTERVTRNTVVNACVKNRQALFAKERRMKGKSGVKKTHEEILAGMNLMQLGEERLAMSRMGFKEKAKKIEKIMDSERKLAKERKVAQVSALQSKQLAELEASHRKRAIELEDCVALEVQEVLAKQEQEMNHLKRKHKKRYDALIGEIATRAIGGISSCTCEKDYLCHHNATASYNTRKPSWDVIRLRQNAQRLRRAGRLEEAHDMDEMAAEREAEAEDQYKQKIEQSIISSAWAGTKSRIEQMVEHQQLAIKSLQESHSERLAFFKKKHDIRRRNLHSMLAAERKKVIISCRRQLNCLPPAPSQGSGIAITAGHAGKNLSDFSSERLQIAPASSTVMENTFVGGNRPGTAKGTSDASRLNTNAKPPNGVLGTGGPPFGGMIQQEETHNNCAAWPINEKRFEQASAEFESSSSSTSLPFPSSQPAPEAQDSTGSSIAQVSEAGAVDSFGGGVDPSSFASPFGGDPFGGAVPFGSSPFGDAWSTSMSPF